MKLIIPKIEVAIWGSGKPLREFLHADDAAAGILHLLRLENPPDWVNLGFGEDISIGDLARLVAEVVGFEGDLTFDRSKPDGTPKKLTDISAIKESGWAPKIGIHEGVSSAYKSFLEEAKAEALRQ